MLQFFSEFVKASQEEAVGEMIEGNNETSVIQTSFIEQESGCQAKEKCGKKPTTADQLDTAAIRSMLQLSTITSFKEAQLYFKHSLSMQKVPITAGKRIL